MYTNRFSQWTKKMAIFFGSASLCFGLLNLDSKAEAASFFDFSIDPAASFVRTYNDPSAKNAIPIALEPLGIRGGDEILLEQLGDFSFDGGWLPDNSEMMIGVFSSSDLLLPSNLPNRVPGAINAGDDVFTNTTGYGLLATDIPEDFSISDGNGFNSISIQVPTDATHLFVTVPDRFYSNNGDPDGDYAVRITTTEKVSTPEPSSLLGLLAFGAVGLTGLKRKTQQKAENDSVS